VKGSSKIVGKSAREKPDSLHFVPFDAIFKAKIMNRKYYAQTLYIVDLAIHGVVCQKSDFHGNSDIQNS
jgi:hypothetical protein